MAVMRKGTSRYTSFAYASYIRQDGQVLCIKSQNEYILFIKVAHVKKSLRRDHFALNLMKFFR